MSNDIIKCKPVFKANIEGATQWTCECCGFSAIDKVGNFPDKIQRVCGCSSRSREAITNKIKTMQAQRQSNKKKCCGGMNRQKIIEDRIKLLKEKQDKCQQQ